MRQYHEGDDLRRIHWPSVARTGELMIRQDESSRRAAWTGVPRFRESALGQTHGPAFERGVSVGGDPGGPCSSRCGFSLRLATADTPPAALSEERFLEALTSVAHAHRAVHRARRSPPSRSASGDTTLVVVAAPLSPSSSRPSSAAGRRSAQACRSRLSRRPRHAAARAAVPVGGAGHAGPSRLDPRRMGLRRPPAVQAAAGLWHAPAGPTPRAARLTALAAVCANRDRDGVRLRTRVRRSRLDLAPDGGRAGLGGRRERPRAAEPPPRDPGVGGAACDRDRPHPLPLDDSGTGSRDPGRRCRHRASSRPDSSANKLVSRSPPRYR